MKILVLLLMVFIISCGSDEENNEESLGCDPSTSSLTTEEISGIWYSERLNMTYNDCNNKDISEELKVFFKFERINECKVKIQQCKDGIACNTLNDKVYINTLKNDKFTTYEIQESEKTEFENCYIKRSLLETASFISNNQANTTLRYDLLIDDECPDSLIDLRCYFEGKVEMKKVGE